MDPATETGLGLAASLKQCVRTALAMGHTRLELLLTEANREALRLLDAMVLIVLGGVFTLMALVMLSLTLIVLFWDEHRLAVLTGLAAVYALAAAGTFWRLRAWLRHWSAFSATVAELRKDKAWLEEKS